MASASVLIKSMFRNWVNMDRIRSDDIRGTELVRCFGDKVRVARLRWFEHLEKWKRWLYQQRDAEVGSGRRRADLTME